MKLFLGQCNVEVADINVELHSIHFVMQSDYPRHEVRAEAPHVIADINNRQKAALDYLKSEGFLGDNAGQWETHVGIICKAP